MPAEFAHLRLHSEYSLVDSVVRIKPLVAAVAASMPAVALTDQSNLMGAVKFYRAALSAGVKPILGVDLWIAEHAEDADPGKLVLLAQGEAGYKNLCNLISRSYIEGQRGGAARVQRDWLTPASTAGLIALSAARHGDIGRALIDARDDEAAQRLEAWRELFGDRFYIELQRIGAQGESAYLEGACRLASATSTPVVATNDVRFIQADEFDAHEARVCINQGRVLIDPARPRDYTEQQYLRSAEEMCERFADMPSACENTIEIAMRCNTRLTLGQSVLPDFPVPAGQSEADYICELAARGLDRRLDLLYPEPTARAAARGPYDVRLQVELDVINSMGFPGYFLIVADFIEWSKNNGVPVGPGRGSGAGSLVAWALGITDIDPLPYDLLFERFLNPERVSMPDFDIDFCIAGRDRVIQYVTEAYGAEKVSQIITYGTMAAKAVVRDCGRVLGHPYGLVDGVAKLVPFEVGMTLTKALDESGELRARYDADAEVRNLIDLALRLEGIARNAGKHAGGVVIAPSGLTDFCPLYCEEGGGSLVTQFDKDDAEAIGLVKFDFLGLRNLTIIDQAVKAINQRRDTPLDITQIPLDDAETFARLQIADTTAVFQLESRGMKELIKRLKPDSFEDIIALVALFRPGPLQSGMVEDFIARKHGRAPVAYPHPDYQLECLKPVLEPTYGIILYQEQVMQIAQVMAGYSLGGADLLRRAMGKKKPEEMAKQKAGFVEGSVANGIDSVLAEKIFELVEKFAGYGFNKSHSAAYALISYQTAWLKRHYPAEFMAAVLTSEMENTDKVVNFYEDCLRSRLEVLAPDVNQSSIHFCALDELRLRYGLGAIKGVGESALAGIVEERERRGPFSSLFDFCERVDSKVNKRVVEALIKSGALDGIVHSRAAAMRDLEAAMKMAEQHHRNADAGIQDLFGDAAAGAASIQASELEEWPDLERLTLEKEALGLYLSGHPIHHFSSDLRHVSRGSLAEQCARLEPATAGRYTKGKETVVAGLINAVRVIHGQRGRRCVITLDDSTAKVDAVISGDLLDSVQHLICVDQVLVVEGELAIDDFSGGYSIRAREAYDIGAARARFAKSMIVTLGSVTEQCIDPLAELLSRHNSGTLPIWFRYQNQRAEAAIRLGNAWHVRPENGLIDALNQLETVEAVELRY